MSTTRPSKIWQAPPGWPGPPAGWSPPPGWEPLPDWPEPRARWKGWKRTRAGRVRLAALVSACALVIVAAVSVTVAATAAVASGLLSVANCPKITVVNDTNQRWQAVACTSDFYPEPSAWPRAVLGFRTGGPFKTTTGLAVGSPVSTLLGTWEQGSVSTCRSSVPMSFDSVKRTRLPWPRAWTGAAPSSERRPAPIGAPGIGTFRLVRGVHGHPLPCGRAR